MADLQNYKILKNTQFEVLTNKGFKPFKGLIVGENQNKIQLSFSNGITLVCTPNHKIMVNEQSYVFAKNLKKGTKIFEFKLLKKHRFKTKEKVYEFLEIADTHTYYANNILCHQCLILDELAFIQNHIVDQFWKSVYPIISSSKKSKIFVASTPNGTNNLFYELYHGATQDATNNNGWKAERIDWWEIPGRDEKWKEDTIKALGSKEAFDQEFGNQFIEVGESVVGDTEIEAMRFSVLQPAYVLDDGAYKIWDPPKKGHLYAAGVDVAEGVGRNASNIEIFDFTDLTQIKQVAEYNNNLINPINFTQKLHEILMQWGAPPVLIERNNQGAQVVDGLAQNFLYKNIVSYSPSAGTTKFGRMGVMAHTNTKYKGVMNMRYWVNERKVVIFRGAEIIEELKNFVRLDNGTWKGRENSLDDRVMSTVWCLMILEKEICEKYYEIQRFDENQKPLLLKGFSTFGGNTQFLEKNDDDYAPMVFFSGNDTGPNEDFRFLEQQGWTRH